MEYLYFRPAAARAERAKAGVGGGETFTLPEAASRDDFVRLMRAQFGKDAAHWAAVWERNRVAT